MDILGHPFVSVMLCGPFGGKIWGAPKQNKITDQWVKEI